MEFRIDRQGLNGIIQCGSKADIQLLQCSPYASETGTFIRCFRLGCNFYGRGWWFYERCWYP